MTIDSNLVKYMLDFYMRGFSPKPFYPLDCSREKGLALVNKAFHKAISDLLVEFKKDHIKIFKNFGAELNAVHVSKNVMDIIEEACAQIPGTKDIVNLRNISMNAERMIINSLKNIDQHTLNTMEMRLTDDFGQQIILIAMCYERDKSLELLEVNSSYKYLRKQAVIKTLFARTVGHYPYLKCIKLTDISPERFSQHALAYMIRTNLGYLIKIDALKDCIDCFSVLSMEERVPFYILILSNLVAGNFINEAEALLNRIKDHCMEQQSIENISLKDEEVLENVKMAIDRGCSRDAIEMIQKIVRPNLKLRAWKLCGDSIYNKEDSLLSFIKSIDSKFLTRK